jgi:hypothetical protein
MQMLLQGCKSRLNEEVDKSKGGIVWWHGTGLRHRTLEAQKGEKIRAFGEEGPGTLLKHEMTSASATSRPRHDGRPGKAECSV